MVRGKRQRKFCSILVLLLAVLLGGCGGGAVSDTVSMYDLRQAMEAADPSLPEMLNLSTNDGNAEEQFGNNITDMDYDKIDDFFVSYAKEGGKADEIIVIAVKDTNDLAEAKQALEDHRESRRKLLEQYEPEEVKRVEDGMIFTEKQYAVLLICENHDAVKQAFEEAVK
jgi:hypothetical protein